MNRRPPRVQPASARYTPRRLTRLRALWWEGKRPKVGDFFSARRPKVVYEIVDIRPCRSAPFALVCLRWNPRDVPAGAVVHPWVWSPRHGIERQR